MEWEELWQKLQKKSVGKKIVEMNSAYEKLGSNISIEEICHGIFDDYEQIRQELDATKRDSRYIRKIAGSSFAYQ